MMFSGCPRCSGIVADVAWAAFKAKYPGGGAYGKLGNDLCELVPKKAVEEAAAAPADQGSARGSGIFRWL